MSLLVRALSGLESKPLWDTMAKEVVGINAPKVVFTRSNEEKFDVAVNELGNTVGFVGAGLVLDKVLQKVFDSVKDKPWAQAQAAKTWETLGRSAAIYSTIFAVMWAMPFLRNYMTAKRTGQVDYTEVIGASPRKKEGATQQQARLNKKLAEYKLKIGQILGLGALGTALGVGGSLLAMNRGVGLNKVGDWIVRNLALKGGAFSDFSGWKALLFWGVPAYGGWIHASRDPFEKKEQVFKFANFVFCFIGPQMLIKKIFQSKFSKLLGEGVATSFENLKVLEKTLAPEVVKAATKLKVFQEVVGLVSSIVLLGVSPAVLNIALTKRRLAKAEASQPHFAAGGGGSIPRGNLQVKSFDAFLQEVQRERAASYRG